MLASSVPVPNPTNPQIPSDPPPQPAWLPVAPVEEPPPGDGERPVQEPPPHH